MKRWTLRFLKPDPQKMYCCTAEWQVTLRELAKDGTPESEALVEQLYDELRGRGISIEPQAHGERLLIPYETHPNAPAALDPIRERYQQLFEKPLLGYELALENHE